MARALRGSFRHFITIQVAAKVATDSGREEKTWDTFAQVFAQRIQRNFSSERFLAGREVPKVQTLWRTNWRDDIAPDMRVRDADGRIYNITETRDPAGDRRLIEIDSMEMTEGDND